MGGTSGILYSESPCADAPVRARIAADNTNPAAAEQTSSPADRHDGWAT